MVALMVTNVLNFLFNSILGRQLSFEEFGLVTLIITFYYLSGIFTTALAATLNFQTSDLYRLGKEDEALAFFKKTLQKSALIAIIISILWILSTPLLMSFFHISEAWVILAFAPVFILSTITYAVIGYLQGSLRFHWAGGVTVTEPLGKLLAGLIIIGLGIGYLAYISIPISLLISSLIGLAALRWIHTDYKKSNTKQAFPRTFYITALTAGIGSTLFFSIDILLIKHFFSAEVTGQYALLSLIGKMMFFFTTLLNIFTLPLAVRMKTKQDSQKLFIMLLGATAALGFGGWIVLRLGGSYIIPFLFGEKARAILSLVPQYTFAIVLFALSGIIVSFHLARREYLFAIAPAIAAILFCLLIVMRHGSLVEVTTNILITCSTLFIGLLGSHLYYHKYGLAYEK